MGFFGITKRQFSSASFTQMANLGKHYSEKLLCYPTQSVNKGKIISNYNHTNLMNVIFDIDKLIANTLELPSEFPTFLHEWYNEIVSCGRIIKKSATLKGTRY